VARKSHDEARTGTFDLRTIYTQIPVGPWPSSPATFGDVPHLYCCIHHQKFTLSVGLTEIPAFADTLSLLFPFLPVHISNEGLSSISTSSNHQILFLLYIHLRHFVPPHHPRTLRSFYSQLSHGAGLFKGCTSSKRVVEVPADLAGGVHRDERAHQDVRRL